MPEWSPSQTILSRVLPRTLDVSRRVAKSAVAVQEVKSLQHWCEELARIPLLHQPGTEPTPQRFLSNLPGFV